MKVRITKTEWRKLGGLSNPNLARTSYGGRWIYWRLS